MQIAGGGHFMFETHADIIFEAAKRFYLQHVDGTLTPIKKTNFDEALHRLPAIAGRPLDLKKRKSRDPFSYSLVTEEAQEEALVMLDEIRKQRASVPFDIPFGDKKLDYHRDVEQIKYRCVLVFFYFSFISFSDIETGVDPYQIFSQINTFHRAICNNMKAQHV